MTSDFADGLELLFGAASDAMCRVFARWPRPADSQSLQLAGKLTGPVCRYADTLQATYKFADRGPGSWLFAEVLVPEPCFWTPAMPQLYHAEVELRDGDRVLATTRRMFGIRRLGADKRQLLLDATNWVLRGVIAEESPKADLQTWHDAETAMCVRNPSDALCDAASREGVLLVAELGKPDVAEIARLRRWPAIGVVAVFGASELDLRGHGGNVILAQRLTADETLASDWANAVCVDDRVLAERHAELFDAKHPVIAVRPFGALDDVAECRRQCDRLQRDLARLGQFAGYIT